MIKLLLCLFASATLGFIVLELRQQRVDINYQMNKLHNQIESRQAMLWNQQLQIAWYTAPNALTETLHDQNLKLTHSPPAPEPKTTVVANDDSNPAN